MRRASALLVLPLLAVATVAGVAGCGSSSSSSQASSADASSSVTATGTFGKAPTVTIPAQTAGSSLTVKTVIHGSGAKLTTSDAFVGNYVAYVWSGKTHKLATSTFTGSPALFSGKLLTGLETALMGQNVGSRVLAVIPPKDGFGSSGDSQLGITGSDTLVFVIDVIQKFANTQGPSGTNLTNGGGALPTVTNVTGAAPSVKIPSGTPPKDLVSKTLIKGTGPTVAKGQTVVVQYTGVIWRTSKVFDSSWSRSAPFGFTIGASPEQVIPGWDKGLVGQTVGSRVMLVIPPKEGYGSAGASQAGIKGTDTLVFVVDILGAVSPATAS
jgi:FKBP-type peptidyl-prolyl cis-trans isomerase